MLVGCPRHRAVERGVLVRPRGPLPQALHEGLAAAIHEGSAAAHRAGLGVGGGGHVHGLRPHLEHLLRVRPAGVGLQPAVRAVARPVLQGELVVAVVTAPQEGRVARHAGPGLGDGGHVRGLRRRLNHLPCAQHREQGLQLAVHRARAAGKPGRGNCSGST
eukprot:5532742-Prymnesium_polylepis.2